MVSVLASGPNCPVFYSRQFHNFFLRIFFDFFSEEKIVHVAEVYQWHCLEESEQWLENVD